MNEGKIHLLIIEDDEKDFLITQKKIAEIPRKKISFDWAKTHKDALEAFDKKTHDVYLMDYGFGCRNGMELIEEAKKKGVDAPIILLTSQHDPLIEETAFQNGAADYLIKETISPEHIERSIRYSLRQARNLKEIVTLHMQLEKRVLERTKKLEASLTKINLSKESLSRSLEKERKLNDMKSRFVSMASHEFRTPLATILSSLSLIEKYAVDGKITRHVSRIRSSVNNMTELLDDVLSLSKLEEGIQTSIPDVVNLREFTATIVQDIQCLLKPGQQIIYEHTDRDLHITVDKNILKNILLNLLSNAIKYSQEGKTILISTGICSGSPIIEVRDYGIGISEEDQRHLFQRFFRGQNAADIQGTGLGLSIVGKYLEILNGKIYFKSVLGEGTTFTVTLPPVEVLELKN